MRSAGRATRTVRFGDVRTGYRHDVAEQSEARPEHAPSVQTTFHRTVDEGVMHLERPLGGLVASGMVGGRR